MDFSLPSFVNLGLSENARQQIPGNVVPGLSGNRHAPDLPRMDILPMTTSLRVESPAIFFQHTQHISHLHKQV
jgi:hypothetical protein